MAESVFYDDEKHVGYGGFAGPQVVRPAVPDDAPPEPEPEPEAPAIEGKVDSNG